MTLYLVCDGAEYEEGNNTDSVWSTSEAANKRWNDLKTAGFTAAFIDEIELDELPAVGVVVRGEDF